MATNPPPCPPKPTPGAQGDSTDDVLTVLLGLLAIGGTIIGIISTAAKATAMDVLPVLGIAAPGVGAIALGAAAGALAVIGTSFAFLYDRCLADPDGKTSCSSGVVVNIVPSFNRPADYMFPFIAQHDLVGVVVKCMYWPLLEQNANYIYTSPPDDSPVFQCLYENKAICPTLAGALIGAIVGGVGGIILGIVLGAALGCAASGPFYLLCLLIAALIAAVVAAICALVGALAGGSIAHAIAGDSDPSADSGEVIHTGDYITTKGKTIISGSYENARIYRFVEHTTYHGHSSSPGPWYSHTDPDIKLNPDACNLSTGQIAGGAPAGDGNPPPPH